MDGTHRTEEGRGVLGIDEAGRGSVVGPLVVGGYLVAEEDLHRIGSLGAKDSKCLTPRAREAVYGRLPSLGLRVSLSLAPGTIDRAVRRNGLNRLEAAAFAALVRRVRPRRVIADACDPVAERFGRSIEAMAGGIAPVRALHHADRDEPLVGAASIVAKVRRDRAVARIGRQLNVDLGSGYPSDTRTVTAVREALGRGDGPAWIRHSWATAERLKPPSPVVPLERYAP